MTLITAQHKYPNYPAFFNLVKRRWNNQKKLDKLLSLIDRHQGCDVSTKLNTYNWNEVELLNIHPLSALKAVLYGHITAIQMATLYQFKNGHAEANGKITIVPLFNNGEVSDTAQPMIQSTLSMNKENTHNHLDEQELRTFFQVMRTKPLSEQRFFVIPNRAPPEDRGEFVETLSHILHELKFEVFSNMSEKRWMIPSFGMMEAFGKVYGKNGYIKIEPVIGFSTRRQVIEGMMTRVRDFAFELNQKVITFDDVDGPTIEGPAHDFFHYHNHLILPPFFLEAFGEIAAFLLDESEYAEANAKKWLNQIIDAIADQENEDLKKDDPGSLNWLPNRSTLFWFLLGRLINEESENLSSAFMSPNLRSLVNHLIEHRTRWLDQYQIDVLEIPTTEQCHNNKYYPSPSINLLACLINSLKSL